MDIPSALQALFGNSPYAYQIRVAEALLSGKNIVLRAPTGAGKTEAALGPYLLAWEHKQIDFPLRCIIASPMRTLAKDLHGRAQEVGDGLGLTVKLHTGEDPTDPLLEADIIVTTVDQLLSNYLHVPYSQSHRGRNIGAGGVVASYVVLDEFHLFDPQRAFRTTLEMARALSGVTPFLFMTATMSGELTQKLAEAVGADFITPSQTELDVMTSQQKTRRFRRVDTMLTAQAVAGAHERRSIAIANTVDRVQTLHADLQRLQDEGHPKLRDVTLALLHSRFFPTHRNTHEQRLKTLLGEGSPENVILVASQAIEVGLNISSENMHTEICPGNALLQRAGRNARYKGENGVVSVYTLPLDQKGEWDTLPYKGQDNVIRATWDALTALPSPVQPQAEEQLIDAVHTAGDERNWAEYLAVRKTTHRDKMKSAFEGDRSMRPALIRDIQNVTLLLVPSEMDLSTWEEVNRHERIGVPWVNFALLEDNRRNLKQEYDLEDNWLVKVPHEVEPEESRSGGESREPTRLEWKTVTDAAELKLETLVQVNPKFVFYTAQEGFRWEAPEGRALGVQDFPPIHSPRSSGERLDYWYTYESYELHIERVLAASYKYAADVWRLCPKVDAKFALPTGTTELALRAAIAAHDIGKLSEGWQRWTRRWQAEQVRKYTGQLLWNGVEEAAQHGATPQGKGEYCAHTDYHPKHDQMSSKTFEKAQGHRPPHAGESAAVLSESFGDFLMDRLGEDQGLSMLQGILGAVCRHHGANHMGEVAPWQLDAGAAAEANRVFERLTGVPLDAERLNDLQRWGVEAVTDPDMPAPDDALAWMVYTLASRALRLGDTRSFEDVRRKEAVT
ncbi:CRISPR-associated helicase Cas3' [Deinococcus gobiensis]|uniref:CRISPR-associated helicase Cas3 n=1 Tax=Deinococcus gobiensis (strain DSM 21396 / JCM 16679 / CGMCC 1.7299 / I-0) TaxID=745776 RepID=H8H1R9_DEIGI|nr:CRISPR-associated helicase Cas3' [Deinococcus gobiensis]AFD27466.1 CRISPR-associated helicase Cas3 [Deinococcus gobiensis I-0]